MKQSFTLFPLLLAFFQYTLPLSAQNYNLQLRSTLEFPDQTLANVWGYTQDGREYALVGALFGLAVVDITNPDVPQLIVQIPGPANGVKEIRTYGHYAYLSSEVGAGLQIVDLSGLPDTTLNSRFYTGDGEIEGQLDGCHTLHVDTTKGFLYLYGALLFSGGAKVFDLNPDPYDPVYVGKFDQLSYIHDGYVDNDTLYACHFGYGILSIVDMHDKTNPQVLGTIETPGLLTHSSWLLSDRKYLLTTDERSGPFLASYDISDPSDIQKLDQTGNELHYDDSSAIVHNTHPVNDWAITSWYIDGVTIVDAHRPENLIQVGRYDTYENDQYPQLAGCYGVYPYSPSGNVVATNIPDFHLPVATGKLFIFTPTYVRACYLEGNVISSCSNQALKDVSIEINGAQAVAFTKTGNDGSYKTGQSSPGNFNVTLSKAGYVTQVIPVVLTPGEVTELNVILEPVSAPSFTGKVVDAQTGQVVSNIPLILTSELETYSGQTDAAGEFTFSCVLGTTYTITIHVWGYFQNQYVVENNEPIIIPLQQGYYDDFDTDFGWMSSGTSFPGKWIRGTPVGIFYSNPPTDVAMDENTNCYLTGNGHVVPSADDVDAGNVTLTTPAMHLSGYEDATLSFWYWFHNSGGTGLPNDYFRVRVSNGQETVTVFEDTTSASEWRFSDEISLSDYIGLTNQVQVHFIAEELAPDHIVEAGVDIFQVVPDGFVYLEELNSTVANLQVMPNPSATSFSIQYDWTDASDLMLEVRNALGQLVFTRQLKGFTGVVQCGEAWPKGLYIASLRNSEHRIVPVKMVKQ